MNREIKFRGYDTTNRRWVYGDLTQVKDSGIFFIGEDNMDFESVRSDTVGQYTGLKDKNGVEIYEGDIIVIPEEYPFFSGGEPNYIGVVEWVYSQWQYIYRLHNDSKANGISNGINVGLNDDGVEENSKTYFEIIGNIHDNPELLNKI